MTRCLEWIDAAQALCGRPAAEVRLRCPAGRPDAVASYCDAHGGETRARAEAEREWCYVAPVSVGDAAAVERAGQACLQTPDAYVVIRQAPAEQGGKWLAWIGLGSLLEQVANPAIDPTRTKGGGLRVPDPERPNTPMRTRRGQMSFGSRDEALAAAVAHWCARVDCDVARIRELRGGTLDWGLPVEPLTDPVVIDLEQGDTRTAWDVAVTLPRRSRTGIAWVSGLRPSGECA